MVLHASTPKQVFPPQTCRRFAAVRFPQSRMKTFLLKHLQLRRLSTLPLSHSFPREIALTENPSSKCVSTPGQRVSFDHSNQAGGSRVCSWREPTKLQVQTRISKEDALSTYLQPELLTTLSHLLCLIPWFFMLPTPKQVSYCCLQPPKFSRASADVKHS